MRKNNKIIYEKIKEKFVSKVYEQKKNNSHKFETHFDFIENICINCYYR